MCDSSASGGNPGSTSVLSPGNGTSLIRPQERWGNWGGSNNSLRWPLPSETLKTYHPPWCLSKHKQIARDFPVYWPWNIEATMRRERTVWLGRWLDYSNVVVSWLISNYHRTEYWALRISSWVVAHHYCLIFPLFPSPLEQVARTAVCGSVIVTTIVMVKFGGDFDAHYPLVMLAGSSFFIQ